MKKNIFVMLISCFSFFCFSQAPEIQNLNIQDAVALALENNISIKRNKSSLETLERANKYSWNSAAPSLNASGNFNLPLDSEKIDNWTIGASVSVSMRLSPSVYTSVQSAKLNYEQGSISYDEAVKTVELNVRSSYYQILYSKENLLLLERNLETAKKRYELNLEKYNKGQLSEYDLLSAQYSYESLIPSIESSQISLENNISTFKQILGISQDVQIELEGSLDDFFGTFDFQFNNDENEIPSIKMLNSKIESAKNQLLATRFSAYGPNISLSYSYGKNNSQAMGGGRSWSDSGNSIGVSISVPLDGFLPWSSGALSVANQKANLHDLELQLEDKKTSINIEIQNNVKKILQAQSQLETIQKNVELAQKKYDLTQAAYNHGSKDFLTLQSAEDSLMDAKIKLMSQKLTLINAVLSLENLLGLPFGTLMDNAKQ